MIARRMFSFYSHALPILAAIAFVGMTAPARAQTNIQITTTDGKSCVATTDTNGVTLVPGSTDLKATGVTFAPAGCGTVSAPPAPTSPNGVLLSATATSTTAPYTYTINWNVSNASSCVGSVSSGTASNVSGWGTFNNLVNGANSAAISISAAGTYTLTLACSNAATPPATLTSPGLPLSPQSSGGGSCAGPAGLSRITTSDVYYGAYTFNTRPAVNLTEWGSLWGHFNTTDSEGVWPRTNGSSPTVTNFQQSNFLAAHFRTGSATTPFGFFVFPFLSAPPMDMAISTTCGDFTATPAGCKATGGSPGDTLVSWTFATNNHTKCILQPNTDYWVNMKFSSPINASRCDGTGQSCPLPTALQSNN